MIVRALCLTQFWLDIFGDTDTVLMLRWSHNRRCLGPRPRPRNWDQCRSLKICRKFALLRMSLQNRLDDDMVANDMTEQIWTVLVRVTKFETRKSCSVVSRTCTATTRLVMKSGLLSPPYETNSMPRPLISLPITIALIGCTVMVCAPATFWPTIIAATCGPRAFARRALRQDSVVAHLPMIAIADRVVLTCLLCTKTANGLGYRSSTPVHVGSVWTPCVSPRHWHSKCPFP
jgi:hypothetical protein